MTELLATLFLPLLGIIPILFINRENTKAIKTTALVVSILTFLVSLTLLLKFDSSVTDFQFYSEAIWIPQLDAGFRIGLDGMSLLNLVSRMVFR